MPYRTNTGLPESVKGHLPAAAQTIYRKAFNSASKEYSSEASAHRVAWSAVKKAYHKDKDGKWVKGKSTTRSTTKNVNRSPKRKTPTRRAHGL
jgi:cation transport regulator